MRLNHLFAIYTFVYPFICLEAQKGLFACICFFLPRLSISLHMLKSLNF